MEMSHATLAVQKNFLNRSLPFFDNLTDILQWSLDMLVGVGRESVTRTGNQFLCPVPPLSESTPLMKKCQVNSSVSSI